jgi:hypothetical protein
LTTQSTANIYGIPVELLDEWWPSASVLIQKAVDKSDGKWTLDAVNEKLKTKDMQLWVACTDRLIAAGITQVQDFPGAKVCYLLFLGGEDMPVWISALDTLERVAIEWGCDYLEIQGREGWKRVLKDYEQTCVVLRKKLC